MSCETFDPRDWLRRFEAAGGWYVVQDDKVWTGWKAFGEPQEEQAREVWRELAGREDRREMVRAILI